MPPGVLLGQRKGAEHVVGLESRHRGALPAERRVQVGRLVELLPDVVLHRLAVGVVALEQLDPVVGGVLTEGHHDRARVVGGDLLQHHVHAAEQRVHGASPAPLIERGRP